MEIPQLFTVWTRLAPAVQGWGWGMMVTHLRAGARRLSALMHAWCPWMEDRPGWVVSVSGLARDKGPLGNRGSQLLRQEQAPFLHQ